MNKYECVVCGLIYDEALGWPERFERSIRLRLYA